jgi:hypothetical protein
MFKFSFPPTKFGLFFVPIEYIFAKRYSRLESAWYPVVEMLPKPELTEDQRKQTVSRLLLLVKEDTLTVELSRRALIYRRRCHLEKNSKSGLY